jgi:hypothetical protein
MRHIRTNTHKHHKRTAQQNSHSQKIKITQKHVASGVLGGGEVDEWCWTGPEEAGHVANSESSLLGSYRRVQGTPPHKGLKTGGLLRSLSLRLNGSREKSTLESLG